MEAETTLSMPTAAVIPNEESSRNMSKEEQILYDVGNRSIDSRGMGFRDKNNSMATSGDKVDKSECGNSDIFYSQYLVVKDLRLSASMQSTENNGVLNFKRFRKVLTWILCCHFALSLE